MADYIIVYASMSGNTEEMAEEIAQGIESAGGTVDVHESFEVEAALLNDYKGILIGTYTWGDGEVPDELLDFYDELEDLDLTGKKGAVFGSFDWSYGDGGIAVDMVREALQEQGMTIIQDDLKVEFDPTPDECKDCQAFGRRLVEAFQTQEMFS